MIGKQISHYKVLEELGRGGMGVVYKAEDTKLDREVAIKFLPRQIGANTDERARFKVEAKAAAGLNHNNIATIHNIEEVGDETFIVMEYIKGQELKDKIEAGPLTIDDTLNLTIQIAKGLQTAHEKGVVHRDIKSANIMLTDKGDVKIMDFGLAKVSGGPKLTKEQSTLGTASYTYYYGKQKELAAQYADSARIILQGKKEAQPGHHRWHQWLGWAYAYQGRYKDAIREGRKAVELLPMYKGCL